MAAITFSTQAPPMLTFPAITLRSSGTLALPDATPERDLAGELEGPHALLDRAGERRGHDRRTGPHGAGHDAFGIDVEGWRAGRRIQPRGCRRPTCPGATYLALDSAL